MQNYMRLTFFKREEIPLDRNTTMILLGAYDGDWMIYNFNLKRLKRECGAAYFYDPENGTCKLSIEREQFPMALQYMQCVSRSIEIESNSAELE